MDPEVLKQINSDAIEDTKLAKEIAFDTHFHLVAGLAAVIAMIVYPIIFQITAEDYVEGKLGWGPSIVASLMGALLIFAWSQRFRNDKVKRREFDKMQLENLQKMAAAVTVVNAAKGLGAIEVDTSREVPQLVQKTAF